MQNKKGSIVACTYYRPVSLSFKVIKIINLHPNGTKINAVTTYTTNQFHFIHYCKSLRSRSLNN